MLSSFTIDLRIRWDKTFTATSFPSGNDEQQQFQKACGFLKTLEQNGS
jgi:hypothetical protein